MKKLIEILPNIYGVKFPNAKWVRENTMKYLSDDCEIGYGLFKIKDVNFLNFHSKSKVTGGVIYNVELSQDEFKILGTITATEISFDASEVVEKNQYWHEGYLDYSVSNEVTKFNWCNPGQSFRSALPKEIYFEHPEGELKYCCNGRDCGCLGFPINIVSKEHWEEYQTAQQNITEKLLILQKL